MNQGDTLAQPRGQPNMKQDGSFAQPNKIPAGQMFSFFL